MVLAKAADTQLVSTAEELDEHERCSDLRCLFSLTTFLLSDTSYSSDGVTQVKKSLKVRGCMAETQEGTLKRLGQIHGSSKVAPRMGPSPVQHLGRDGVRFVNSHSVPGGSSRFGHPLKKKGGVSAHHESWKTQP